MINYDNPASLHNWVERLDLSCDSGFKIGLLGSALFAGWAATLLILSPLGDIYGRKRPFWWGQVFRTIIFSVILLSKSYWLTVSMLFLVGTSQCFAISIGFNYLMELVGKPYRSAWGAAWMVNEDFVTVLSTIYFGLISKKWFPFLFLGYIVQWISMIGTYFLPESPVWLVSTQQYEEADIVFEKIASWNGTTYRPDELPKTLD